MTTTFKRKDLIYEPTPQHQLYQEEDFGKTDKIHESADSAAQHWLKKFGAAVESKDVGGVVSQLADAAIWRDLLALQWKLRSFSGKADIREFLTQRLAKAELRDIEIDNDTAKPSKMSPLQDLEWVQICFKFNSRYGKGRGVVRLVREDAQDQELKIFTIMTMLEEIEGHEEALGHRRPLGVNHGQHANRESYLERRARETSYGENKSPAVLIVGGGQAGLSVAARLKLMGIDALIVESNGRIGDNWRKRYKFLVLHDVVYYDHLPYMHYPASWPVFTPKDKLADFFEFYVKALDLNVWTSSTVQGGEFNDGTKTWNVRVKKADGSLVQLAPRHVIQATGHSGEPNIPKLPGSEKFKGKIAHSSQHGSGADWKGKNAVVVGCCNSGMDIAHDFYEQGANTTLYQRSSSYICSSEGLRKVLFEGAYSEDGPEAETADLIDHSLPGRAKLAVSRDVTSKIAEYDDDTLRSLEKIGFKVDYGFGGSGFWGKYIIRGGGYYLDVGACKLLIDGDIKLKQGGDIVDFTENSVKFSDGTELPADIVVLATGYQNMRSTARRIFGDKVADRLGDAWGLNAEHEFQNMWTESGHPGYYYMGGNLALCRFYSKRLALRIVAEEAALVG